MCEVAETLINEGMQQGMNRINILYKYLIKEHREDDFEKCMDDKDYLNRLLEELDI